MLEDSHYQSSKTGSLDGDPKYDGLLQDPRVQSWIAGWEGWAAGDPNSVPKIKTIDDLVKAWRIFKSDDPTYKEISDQEALREFSIANGMTYENSLKDVMKFIPNKEDAKKWLDDFTDNQLRQRGLLE